MKAEHLRTALSVGTDDAHRALLDHDKGLLWVDWRDAEDAVLADLAALIGASDLSLELGDDETLVRVLRGERVTTFSLRFGPTDRHELLRAANVVLAPEFEVRFVKASAGSDTLAFAVLPSEEWVALERRFGDELNRRFLVLLETPNFFADASDEMPEGSQRGPASQWDSTGDAKSPRRKPWWRFW